MTTRRRRSWTQRGGLALALCLPASAAAALALHAVRAAEVPAPSDWKAAAQAVRSTWQPDDIIAFLPGWAQEGRGEFAGLRAVPDESWDEESLASARRVHLISSFGAPPPAWLKAGDEPPTRRFGRLALYTISRSASAPLFDFTGQLSQAQAELQWPGRPPEVCVRSGARHDCTQQNRLPWRRVAEERLVSGGRSYGCIWAHPTTGASLSIRFPAVPLGQRLRVVYGLSDGVAGRGGAPITLGIRVGDVTQGTFTQGDRAGWSRREIATGAFSGRTEPVTFLVTTPDDGSRHFCFAVEALP